MCRGNRAKNLVILTVFSDLMVSTLKILMCYSNIQKFLKKYGRDPATGEVSHLALSSTSCNENILIYSFFGICKTLKMSSLLSAAFVS